MRTIESRSRCDQTAAALTNRYFRVKAALTLADYASYGHAMESVYEGKLLEFYDLPEVPIGGECTFVANGARRVTIQGLHGRF